MKNHSFNPDWEKSVFLVVKNSNLCFIIRAVGAHQLQDKSTSFSALVHEDGDAKLWCTIFPISKYGLQALFTLEEVLQQLNNYLF